jgi:hypothetical protein
MTDPYSTMTGPFLLQKASENKRDVKKRNLGQPSRQEAGQTERHHGGAQGADPACARPGRLSQRKPKVVPDAAKDAVACFMETEERRQRGRHSPSEGRLCVKTDSLGKGPAAQ